MSLTAYAKRRGVSTVAVSKAIATGRLRESVIMVDGQPKIRDPEFADREWEANTRPRVDQQPAPGAAPKAKATAAADPDADQVPDYFESRARREAAAARREAALAELAELDVDERKGELVPTVEARADVIDKFTIVKTRILGVPTRVAQRLPHVAAQVVPVLDELLREALDELAIGDVDDREDSDASNDEA